ncbi:hypothetical protein [Streptomyces sp. NPDC005989]|uniref:hypothetical protein n=1 Tax=Streptomyces sp. NPDC005989 TaxID=3156727 RepID=UPI0033CFFFED
MDATIVTAAVGALGIAGTLAAARIQAKGAVRQAEASLVQAHATHTAAVETVAAQARSAFVQAARDAQRPVYVALIDATHAFADSVTRRIAIGEWETNHGFEAEARSMRIALSRVELEGPESLISLAQHLATAVEGVRQSARSLCSDLDAWHALYAAEAGEAPFNDTQSHAAAEAVSALDELHSGHPESTTSRERLRTYTHRDTGSGSASVSRFVALINNAEEALVEARAAGVLPPGGMRLIARAVDRDKAAFEILLGHLEEVASARETFTGAARIYLHSAAP